MPMRFQRSYHFASTFSQNNLDNSAVMHAIPTFLRHPMDHALILKTVQ